MIKSLQLIWFVTALASLVLLSGCDSLSVKKSIADREYSFTNQFGEDVLFPDHYSGKIMLVGYVYTHCPDICPMITYNMRDVQRALVDEENFKLVSISFDPDRDTPEILHDYAQNYRVSQDNWSFLTGQRSVVEQALETLEIQTVKTPTRFLEDNRQIYFIDHTDRVTLIDGEGNIRKTYHGSEFDIDDVVSDIRTLLSKI